MINTLIWKTNLKTKDTIKQSDINIIGIVLLSQKDLNRSAIINEIAIKGNVYVVN